MNNQFTLNYTNPNELNRHLRVAYCQLRRIILAHKHRQRILSAKTIKNFSSLAEYHIP